MKMLRPGLITTTLLMALAIGAVMAETPPTNEDHDVIVLKNGSVARGRILTSVEGSPLVLEVANGKTINIDSKDIEFVTDKKNFDPATVPVFRGSHLSAPERYHLFLQGAVLPGGPNPGFSASAAVGPQVTDYLVVAVGPQVDSDTRGVLTGRIHIYLLGDLIQGDDGFKESQVHFSAGVGQFVTDRADSLRNCVTNLSLGVGRLHKLDGGRTLMVELGYHYQSMFTSAKHVPDEDFLTLSVGLRY